MPTYAHARISNLYASAYEATMLEAVRRCEWVALDRMDRERPPGVKSILRCAYCGRPRGDHLTCQGCGATEVTA